MRTIGYERTYAADGTPLIELIPVEDSEFDKVGWTNLFYQIPTEQMKILVCMFLGMTPEETMAALHFRNIGRYYSLTTKLHETYQLRKAQFID